MRSICRRIPTFLTLVAVLAAVPPASAQGPGGGPSTAGWHIVRPGESLEAIARLYLGRSGGWRELVRLNPGLENPDVLSPGERIKVQLKRGLPSAVSQVGRLAGSVEEKPRPVPWTDGRQFDLLEEGDGVRTFPRSSVELTFADTTRLVVTEDSLVFIRGNAAGNRLDHPGEIEIVRGQADLNAGAIRRPETRAVEIVLGHAAVRSTSTSQGDLATRARREKEGQSQVMVFKGRTEVEALGSTVAVNEGFGTAIPADGPASAPEPLLPAPEPLAPAPGASFGTDSPRFRWKPVKDAAFYALELCLDHDCARLIARETGLPDPSWQASSLLPGNLFWRVTAVAGNALDGYPSEVLALALVPEEEATRVGAIRAEGPQAKTADGRLVLGRDTRMVADLAGPADAENLVLLLDGSRLEGPDFTGPWPAGSHEIQGELTDAAGNPMPLHPLRFLSDSDPPELTWKLEGGDSSGARSGGGDQRRARPWKRVDIDWSPDGMKWQPLIPAQGPGPGLEQDVMAEVELEEEVFLRRRRRRPFGPTAPVAPRKREVIHVRASDATAGLASFTLQVVNRGGTAALLLRAEDRVGNSASEEWPMARCRWFCGPKIPSGD